MKNNKPLHIFLVLSTLGVLSFVVLNRIFNGYFFEQIFFGLTGDTLYDFFVFLNQNSTSSAAFVTGSNPPLVRFIFRFVFKSLPDTVQEEHPKVNLSPEPDKDLRINAFASLCFILMILFALVFMAKLCYDNFEGTKLQKKWFVVLALLSTGVIWAIERGNIVIWAMVCTMYFCFYYDSEDKKRREISYLLLGIAISLKIYPVLFGLFLLKKKDIKGILKTILYVAIFILFPLFITGGFDTIRAYICSLFNQVSSGSNLRAGYLNGLSVMLTGFRVVGYEEFFLNHLWFFRIINYAFSVLISFIAVFVLKKKWMKVTMLVFAMFWLPGITHTYMLSFIIIPLVMFLNEEDKISVQNVIAIIGFVLLTTILPIPNGELVESLRDQTVVNVANRLSGFMLIHILGEIILSCLIMIRIVIEGVQLIKQQLNKKIAVD